VILGSLAGGESRLLNFLRAEDPLRTLHAFRQMGVSIGDREKEIIVSGKGLHGLQQPGNDIDCGNSGTTMRLMSGVLAAQPFSSVLTGDASLRKRPMQRVITPLSEMDALITSEKDGYPPLRITGGKLKPISYRSPVASAQVKSALLLAGLYCDGITTVIEPERSRDHTERMLKACGAEITVQDTEVSVKGISRLRSLDMTIPNDFSSAAFFIAAGLLVPGSEIYIRDTGVNATRTGFSEILERMGAAIRFENERMISGEPVADIYVRHEPLNGIEIQGEAVLKAIDEFPILCVVASVSRGVTKITGARELRVKESDRIASMTQELRKMGVETEELEDGIIVKGRERLASAVVNSHGDHRVAMALLIAGLLADGETTVEDTDCINTSFPGFPEILHRLEK
jgi:3-phosphoshikimate 1-carboxyvinyltransferase